MASSVILRFPDLLGLLLWRSVWLVSMLLTSTRVLEKLRKQAKMEEDYFGVAWCHVGIFGSGENTVDWCFISGLYYMDDFLMI